MPFLKLKASARVGERQLDPEDRAVAGDYRIWVDVEVARENLEAAALDVFHSRVAVSTLDDFDFSVTDDGGVPLTDQVDSESYAFSHAGRLA